MSKESNAVVLEPPQPANASVIWLHGLGADGHDFEPVVAELGAAITQRTRFIFPHAPEQPVTVNGGMVMRAWYDIKDAAFPGATDITGIRRSEAILNGYIAREVQSGIAPDRIVLAGFSQGGVIALRTGLLFAQQLAGIVALSTYLPMQGQTSDERHPANQTTPIFLAHGILDPLIPIDVARTAQRYLNDHDYVVEWREYHMQHSVNAEEIRDIRTWLSAVLP